MEMGTLKLNEEKSKLYLYSQRCSSNSDWESYPPVLEEKETEKRSIWWVSELHFNRSLDKGLKIRNIFYGSTDLQGATD